MWVVHLVQIIITLFLFLGGYAFFWQSRLAIEVLAKPPSYAHSPFNPPCLHMHACVMQDTAYGFTRSRGFKGEGDTSMAAEVGMRIMRPKPFYLHATQCL